MRFNASAMAGAVEQVRLVMMASGSYTLAQVNEHADGLARAIVGAYLARTVPCDWGQGRCIEKGGEPSESASAGLAGTETPGEPCSARSLTLGVPAMALLPHGPDAGCPDCDAFRAQVMHSLRVAVDCGARPECATMCSYDMPCLAAPRRVVILPETYCGDSEIHKPHTCFSTTTGASVPPPFECPGRDENYYVPGTVYCRQACSEGHTFTDGCALQIGAS